MTLSQKAGMINLVSATYGDVSKVNEYSLDMMILAFLETFLVKQWINVCLPMQGTWVRSLVWEDPTCHRTAKPTATELAL